MKRREFITLVGSAAAPWPQVALAQQAGVLMPIAADDPDAPLRIAAFTQGLQEFGWVDGRNVRVEYRWAGANEEKARQYALELTARAVDVIFALGNASVAPLLQASRTVPIVFAVVPDPVGAGFVNSLARR
jgi:putative ABC transport system substrate-binding protein